MLPAGLDIVPSVKKEEKGDAVYTKITDGDATALPRSVIGVA